MDAKPAALRQMYNFGMRFQMEEVVSEFFKEVEAKRISIYNEFSLQHEFGIFLRASVDQEWKVEFEKASWLLWIIRNS